VADVFNGISVPQGLALAAIGGLGYHLFNKRKRKRR